VIVVADLKIDGWNNNESVSKSSLEIKIDAAGNVDETAIRFAANDACGRHIYSHIFTLSILFGRKTVLPRRRHNIDDAQSDQNAHNDDEDKLKQLKDLHVLRVQTCYRCKVSIEKRQCVEATVTRNQTNN